MELKGTYNSIPVIDDYGHHPTEVKATISAVKEAYPDKRLVCVFQPHMHDRTLKLYDEFLESFAFVDVLIIPNIYDARSDVEREHVDVDKFVSDIKEHGPKNVLNGKSLRETETLLAEMLQPNDVLLCMGAGDITDLAEWMVA